MRAISDFFRSLYSLTKISLFYDIANTLYRVEQTGNKVKKVKDDADRARKQFDNNRKSVG
jgi:hypothetical protein